MKKLEDCRSAYDDALKKYNKQNNVEKRAKVGCIDFNNNIYLGFTLISNAAFYF